MIYLLLLSVGVVLAQGQDVPPTVDELDIPLYTGLWYQTYASPLVLGTFEKDGLCVTATYGVYNATTLTVYNYMRKFTPDGEVSDIDGFAYATEDPGKLMVSLNGGNPAGGNYWVMQLGPVNEYNGVEQYSYSLVSEASRSSLFVLVRDVAEFQELYEEDVLEWLYDNGFDSPLNNPVPVYHGEDCLYPEEDEEVQEDVPTVDELDIPLYTGLWYQTYASPLVLGTFEKDGLCVTATYGVYNATTLTVYNHMRKFTPDGEVSDIDGFAYATEDPGKLIVNLIGGAPDSSYWVMQLGPVNEYNGVEQYSYSLVSEASRSSLFVLVRDVAEFQELYEEDVLEWLYDNGFDSPLNNPLPVYQGEDCLYPEEEEEDSIPTVDELDLPSYLGRWHTMFASPFVLATELNDQLCVTADYAVYNDSTITVYNHGRTSVPDGESKDIYGYAYLTEETGKLLVDFGFENLGDYWVMQLGPVSMYDGEELYSYSLVSTPSQVNLYVLARDPEEFQDLYEADVLSWLSSAGFDKPTNNPLPVYQGSDCVYA